MSSNGVKQRITAVQCTRDFYSQSMHTSAQCLRGGVFAPSSVTALSFILPQMSFTACHWIRRGEAVDINRTAALKHQCGGAKQSLVSQATAITYSLPNLQIKTEQENEIETFSHPPTRPVTSDVGPSDAAWGACLCGGVDMCVGVFITA